MKYITTIGIIGILFLIVSFAGCSQIEAGFAGVKTRFGRVCDKEPLSEGLALYNPISDKVHKYDCRTTDYQIKTSLYDGDNQDSTWAVSVRYHLDRSKVVELHNTVGKDYLSKLFLKPVNDTLKNIVGKIKTDDLVKNREIICKQFTEQVNAILSVRGIVIEQLTIDDIDLPSEYEAAILQKNVALQNKERQVYESEQAVTKAKGDAAAQVASAEGSAKAKIVTAEADAKSIKIRGEALEKNPKLVLLEGINRWDGKLPTYMLGGNGVLQTFELNGINK